MKAPSFWQVYPSSLLARLLTPFSFITEYITRSRLSKSRYKAPVPVICCGNLTVGGTGKTTVALALGQYFLQYYKVAFLTRGYKSKSKITVPILVDLKAHKVDDVGDEALLLVQLAPTWVCADRAASSKAAIQQGAELLIMDDGFQNPTLYQELPILIVDGVTGFGNGKALPAGPLRESLQDGMRRAKACVIIGKDETEVVRYIPKSIPVFHATLEMDKEIHQFAGQSVIAFAGLGRPSKFFQSLKENALHLVKELSFPDHYSYQQKDLDALLNLQQKYQVPLVTTPKDYARLPVSIKGKIIPLGVHLKWQDQDSLQQIKALLDSILDQDVKE